MKKNTRILPIIFSLTVLTFIIGSYWYINSSHHFHPEKAIPAYAQTVVYTKPTRLLKDFHDLLKNNPTLLDSITDAKIDIHTIAEGSEGAGITPLSDVTIFGFPDKEAFIIGAVLDVFNHKQFYRFIASEQPLLSNYKTGEIAVFTQAHFIVLTNDAHTVIMKAMLYNSSEALQELAELQFENIFVNKNLLIKKSQNFNHFVKSQKHLGVWASKDNIEILPVNDFFDIFKNFGDKYVDFTASKEHINLDAELELLNADFFVPADKKPIHLSNHEIAKVSLATTPDYVKNILQRELPASHHYLTEFCTGELCSAFTGYRKKVAYVTKMVERIDKKTYQTVKMLDTVEFSPLINIPELMTVVKIKDATQLTELLQSDSLAINKQDYWKVPHPLFLQEYIYVKVKNNLLYIGTNPSFDDITPEFTTFSVSYHLKRAVENYPPKNAVQQIGLSALPPTPVSTVRIYFDTLQNDTIHLHGDITFVENKHHSLLQLFAEVLKYRGLLKGLL